jgi:alpha-L-rhamnosidase
MMLTPTSLRTNGRERPIGLDQSPEFSWRVEADDHDVLFGTARVQLKDVDGETVWDSGETPTDGVPTIRYGGAGLPPRSEFTWRVQVSDADGKTSDWSEPATFETGIGDDGLSEARWIRLDEQPAVGETAPVQYFRREFDLAARPVRARAYATALGWYRLGVNGTDASGPGLFPAFTAFESRVEYQARDITELLRVGSNVVSLKLADGRFRGRIGALGEPAVYGNRTAVIARIEIDLENGDRVVIGTDDTWEGGHDAIGAADPRAGEVIDARRRGDGDRPGGSFFAPAPVIEVDESRSFANESAAPFLAGAELSESARRAAPSGATVIDLGQNFHGVARLRVSGPAGAQLVVHHSEVLTPEGEVDLDYLFGGMPVDIHLGPNRFTLSGGENVFEPTFSTQGFRYISIEASEGVEVLEATGIPLHAAIDYAGSFSSSHTLVDRFHENVAWSMRGNFLDVPTDCPTRERSGWTGDAQVFAPTALLMADTAEYLRNWLADARLQQHSDGTIPDIVPVDADAWREGGAEGEMMPGVALPPPGSAGWGDAIVLIPWSIHEATGSIAVLEENYAAMSRWVERYAQLAARGADPDDRYFVDSGYHWGEWLEPAGEGDGSLDLMGLMADLHARPRAWVATAYFERSSRTLSQIASLLGRDGDAARFLDYAEGALEAWRRHYLGAEGKLIPDAQATYVRALEFSLVPDELRAPAAQRLVERIRERDTHLGTGFLSTGFLLGQLSDNGADDVALDLMLQQSAPSWLGQVVSGATTIWETWTGADAEGRPALSHNHYSLGASARWLYERLAGIRAGSPGWRTITVDPLLNRRVPRVAASTRTPFGDVAIEWNLVDDRAEATVDVPPGATATMRLRGVTAGTATLDGAAASLDGDILTFGSGRRHVAWTTRDDAIVA